MSCPRCGKKIERGWNFCPFCGFRPGSSPVFGGAFGGIMDKLMKKLAKQMEDIDRGSGMERNFEVMDLSPMFKNLGNADMENMQKNIKIIGKPGARGFTLRISRTNTNEPKVDVKTFGNVDESMEKQIQDQLDRMGIKQPVRVEQQEQKESQGPRSPVPSSKPEKPKGKKFPEPKICEEPKTEVKRIDSRVFVDMDMPGVKSDQDIDINELEGSVEVRASAGDKAYFKILTKPAQFSLQKRDFKGCKLHLEFA